MMKIRKKNGQEEPNEKIEALQSQPFGLWFFKNLTGCLWGLRRTRKIKACPRSPNLRKIACEAARERNRPALCLIFAGLSEFAMTKANAFGRQFFRPADALHR